jgi:hypothetical protein
MAIRIHVTVVRDCSAAEVRAVFTRRLGEGFGAVAVCEQNGWTWFTTSVWGVGGDDLNRGLCELARPGLQFTTSDGDRWYLTIHGGPTGTRGFLHEFGYHSRPARPEEDADRAAELAEQEEPPAVDPDLAFLEEDPVPGAERPRAPFDLVAEGLAGVGVEVLAAFRDTVVDLPYSAALNRYREWHAEQVSAALAAAGIPHDAAALRAVLLWENVTAAEHDSDLGNLPRLLSVLGLGGDWDNWVRQAESPPEPAETCALEEAPEPPPDFLGQVERCVAALPLVQVTGGPVPLPLKQLDRLAFLSEACSTRAEPTVALRVDLPPGTSPPPVAARGELDAQGQVAQTPSGFQVGLLNNMWLSKRDLNRILGKPLADLLFHLPEGTVLEAAFAAEDQPATWQRYRGSVRHGTWEIDRSAPPLPAAVLLGALELAARRGRVAHRARDAAEAEAIMAAVRKDSYLHNMGVERRGATVRCQYDLGQLSILFFRHRYRDYWDFGLVEQEVEKEYQERREREREWRKAGAEAARRRAAPHAADVLLEGEHGRYWASDFTWLDQLEQETRERFDAAVAALGFQHAGDLVAKKQRDIVLRVWASPDRLAYGILMAKRTMYLGCEFFSRFADGSTLTTTTNAAVDSHPAVGIYYKVCPGLDVPALWEKHCWGVGRFQSRRHTGPAPLDPTLPGVARELDAAFARRAQVGD